MPDRPPPFEPTAETPARRPEFLGSFESTYLPEHGIDVSESTQHDERWRADIDAVLRTGVRRLRYPLRWHRIEAEPGRYDWSATDAVLGYLHDKGADPVVDLVHHTSYPRWLTDGFRDPRFHTTYLRHAEAVATRYPWLCSYTLFNEPFATLFLAGHEALWPPYDRGPAGFVRLLRNVLPAISQAAQCWSDLLPDARHFWVDTCERHAGTPGGPAAYAALANDRRHIVLDLTLGHDLRPERPFLRTLLEAGGESLLDVVPVRVDVLGLDYYCHSEWWYDEVGGHAPSPHPIGFAAVAEQYADRCQLPMLLAETNIRGLPSDRVSWLRYMLQEYETAVAGGVPLDGFCWFPHVDSSDWDSLLARPAGRVDPVGVYAVDGGRERVRTVFTESWEAAAAGATSAELPAYRFQSPCAEQLLAVTEQLDWAWQEPPTTDFIPPIQTDFIPPIQIDARVKEPAVTTLPQQPDLVVLSHLRWEWVWQRPQHLVSRWAKLRSAAGARTWFVEEPEAGEVTEPELRHDRIDGINRVWLVVPTRPGQPKALGFDADDTEEYGTMVADLLAEAGSPRHPDVLLYTPMALDIAAELSPGRLMYDVMDDLASFMKAPQGLQLRQRRLLSEADVVFTGGRSLHAGVSQHRTTRCHLFPSGVETSHYAKSRSLREPHDRKVAGYVGVIDERIDLELVAKLAAELPDWTIRIVGPIAKIEESDLPQAPNLEYPGMTAYGELPRVMAGFDVALMPFALNEATRSISPTKTLEYLAAGLPVVSTRVADVVTDYSGVVHFADDAAGFAVACEEVVEHSRVERDRRLRPIQERQEWDYIASSMAALMVEDATGPAVIDLTVRGEVTA